MVLVFPEGSRSLDGQVGKLKPGFCALARRSGVQVMPVAIAGAFEAWPRSKRFPRPKVIQIQFGLSLGPEQIRSYSDPELIAEIRRRLIDCHAAAVRGVQRAKQFHASGTFGEADLSGEEANKRAKNPAGTVCNGFPDSLDCFRIDGLCRLPQNRHAAVAAPGERPYSYLPHSKVVLAAG